MLVLKISLYIIIISVGYLLGRFGHYYLNVWLKNPKWAPHHWIFGLIFIVLGLFFYKNSWGLSSLYFGLGFFTSDLKDFLQLKIIGPDKESKKKFWGID